MLSLAHSITSEWGWGWGWGGGYCKAGGPSHFCEGRRGGGGAGDSPELVGIQCTTGGQFTRGLNER